MSTVQVGRALTGCVFAGRAARPLSVEVVALERLALLAERRVLAVVRAAERVRAAQRAQRRRAARAAPQRRAARHARPADTQLLRYTFTCDPVSPGNTYIVLASSYAIRNNVK